MPNHHDILFKAIFSEPGHAQEHFERFLPPEVAACLDLSKLERVPGSFVTKQSEERHTDLLFKAPTTAGGDAYVYLLFEHQGTVHPLMPLRMLGYMVNIWETHSGEHKSETLPPIIPMVLYQGREPWTPSPAFDALLSPDAAFRPYVPDFRMLLTDLVREDDDHIGPLSAPGLTRLLMKYAGNPRLESELAALGPHFAAVERADPFLNHFDHLMHYVYRVLDDLGPDEVQTILSHHVGPRALERMMSIADRLWANGHDEGRQEGRREGLTRLEKQLACKFGELDPATAARLSKATTEELDRWAVRLLSANRIEDVVDG